MKKRPRILAFIMALVLMASSLPAITAKADTCGGLEAVDVYQPAADEVIQDPILHWAIRAAMNSIQSDVKLTAEVVGDKSVRDISYELCAHPEDFETDEWAGKQFWIESLEGLQYAKSATMIDIGYTSAVEGKRIKDLSPLSGLIQLEKLILKQNGIDNIEALSGLVNLKTFDVAGNQILEDISAVEGMVNLESLNASFNNLKSVDAISNLNNLEYVSLSDNSITELPDLSKLTKVYFLDLSHNQLTDVSEIGKMTGLQQLNLAGNSGITDITPLASLLRLEKDNTTLPDNSKKDDLFAAIEVNKLFNLFNISKMKESDIANVQNALAAYDALTEEQKTYFEDARIEAARSNLQKVQNGAEPDYYPEYDVEGEKQPVFSSLEISVVDKNGTPMEGVSFDKVSTNAYAESTTTVTTDSVGKFVLKHTSLDPVYDLITIKPSGDTYVAEPESITYTVAWGNTTATVNGKPATGLEELKFVLIPADEYVDKSALEDALGNAENVERAYKYTEESYQAYEAALTAAENCLADVDATKEDVANAAEALNKAISELVKADVLTELKLVVKDVNGNIFHRAFKFQIRVPETGAEAWNDFTCPYSGAVYLKTSPGWEDGKVWEIVACHEEAYEITPIIVTIGVTEDGQRYFKTVDGEEAGVDFEKEVTATYLPDQAEGARKPSSKVLEELLAIVKEINTSEYTSGTVEKLTKAIADAEAVIEKSDVIQEDYNAAITSLLAAKDGLTEAADKAELRKEINKQYSYSENSYTAVSWENYQSKLAAAEEVNADGDATQEEVDTALAALMQAANELVLKADKSELETKLNEAKALSADDYQSGFDALESAITEAEAVYNNETATQAEVNEQVTALQEAMDALVKKPVEVDYSCFPGVFRAKVVDAEGKPVAGAVFESVIDGKAESEKLTSDANGIITYYVYGQNRGKTTYIRLADEKYVTEDEHYFEADGINDWVVSMTTIDGAAYADGTKLTYVVREPGTETPDPGPGTEIPDPGIDPTEKVLSDESTFRAKVTDQEGKPVAGVKFNLLVGDTVSGTITSNASGVLEYAIGMYEGYKTYTVTPVSETATPASVDFVLEGYPTKIVSVDGKAIAEVEEVVFVLGASGGETPEVVDKKELDDQVFFAKSYEGKADDYIAETYQVFEAALAEAKKVLADEAATQEQVDEAAKALKEAREGLVKVEKPAVSDKYNIRIQIVDEDGNAVNDAIPFKVGTSTQNSRNGVIEYAVSTADSGTSKIVISLKDETVTIGDKTYVADPEQHEFTLEEYAGDIYISAINGETLEGTKEVKFVLKEKIEEPDSGENPEEPDKPVDPEQPEVKAFDGTVKLGTTKYIYNGKVRKPTVTVKDSEGKKLTAGEDYKVTYPTGRKNVGRYGVKVTFSGQYTGKVTKYFTIVPKAVTNLKAIRYQYGNKVRLSWTKSTGATGYRIYRKKASASSYTYLGATKNAYYINSGLTKNTSYRYKVIPYYKTSTGTTHYYSTNAYKTVLINTVTKGNKLSQVTKVKAAKSGTKVKVSWKNVSYETGYQISRSTSKTGTNIVATYKTTSGKSKVVTATKNKTYYYKVRAYRVVNGKKIYGAWSSPVKYTRK